MRAACTREFTSSKASPPEPPYGLQSCGLLKSVDVRLPSLLPKQDESQLSAHDHFQFSIFNFQLANETITVVASNKRIPVGRPTHDVNCALWNSTSVVMLIAPSGTAPPW